MTTPVPARRIAVLAPMPIELRPFVRLLSLCRVRPGDASLYSGVLGKAEVVASLAGMGTASAARTTERVLGSGPVDQVVVIGIAGALDRNVAIGELVVPESVLDGSSGAEYRPTPLGHVAPRGKLHTSDELILDEPRLSRLRAQGVVALDMETAAVAAVCERHGVPWSVFRAISDRATDGTVDEGVLAMTRPDGTANLVAVARFLLRRPWAVPRLVGLARGSMAAASAAAAAAHAALADEALRI